MVLVIYKQILFSKIKSHLQNTLLFFTDNTGGNLLKEDYSLNSEKKFVRKILYGNRQHAPFLSTLLFYGQHRVQKSIFKNRLSNSFDRKRLCIPIDRTC
jgi:hypothetical protein